MEPPDKIELEARVALAAFKKGDSKGMRMLLECLGPRVYSFLKSLMGSAQDAEDVMQETFSTIFQKARQQNPALGSVRGWVYAIAKNHALQILRRRAPGRQNFPQVSGNPQDPAVIAEKKATMESLDKAIQALPLELKLPFLMRECLGLTYSQIGELIEKNDNQVASDIFRARNQIRDILKE